MLQSVLNCYYDSLNIILMKEVEKWILFQNLRIVLLALDEICDIRLLSRVRNFLAEKYTRCVRMHNGVNCENSKTQKDELIITDNSVSGNKAVLSLALDRRNKDYFTCDASCLDPPVQLSTSHGCGLHYFWLPTNARVETYNSRKKSCPILQYCNES